jgi:hypothetical protein
MRPGRGEESGRAGGAWGYKERSRTWMDVVRMPTSLDRLTKWMMSMRTGVPKQRVTVSACGAKRTTRRHLEEERAAEKEKEKQRKARAEAERERRDRAAAERA